MQFKTALLNKYQIVAKDLLKMELEALADQMSEDEYAIFTKTQELKWDKDLSQWSGELKPQGLLGHTKKALYNMDRELLKKAKYAHIVKKVSKKIINTDIAITDSKALSLAKKFKHYWITTPKDIKQYKENPNNRNVKYKDGIRLLTWLDILLPSEPMEQTKALLDLGYDVLQGYGENVLFLDSKALKVIATYRLDLPKEEKVDKTLTPEEKKLLEDYAPDLGDHTSFRAPMPIEKLGKTVAKMSDDDLAWHLLTSKKAMDIGNEDFVRNRFGFREICLLQLMNKNLSKKDRTQVAEYMLDKAGATFVGGPTLKKYITALAKTGTIDERILKAGHNDQIQDDIYYGRITDPDELRKIDYKEFGYQLAHNPHTPPDVLEKIVAHDNKTQSKDSWQDGEIKWSGTNPKLGGTPGDSYNFSFSDTLNNPNYPLDKLLAVFRKYQAKYKDHPKAVKGMVSTLWRRPDLSKETAHELVAYEDKYNKKYKLSYPPACFDEKEILDYWKDVKEKNYYGIVSHPHVPSEILWDALKVDDEEQASAQTKTEAYKKLKERGEITDKDSIAKVKKDLKFDGPDELLKHFDLQAWLGTKGKEKLKFTKVSAEELKKLQTEMKAATTHEDFTFKVVDAYTVDKQIHKDYPKKAKEIGNIKHGLYHGTSMANAAGILATGINTKAESRTGAMFGNGFYLASSASKAAQYASDNFSKSGYGIVFKMDAALGKSAEWKYGRPESDNFMRTNKEDRKDLADYAKKAGFKDVYDVPRWHLTHDSVWAKKGLALNFDEMVVREGQQINITEIIIVNKEEK